MHHSQPQASSQVPDRSDLSIVRTSDLHHTQADPPVNHGMTLNDTITGHYSSGPTPKDRRVTPEDRQTVPARHSFEEKQYELVRKSVIGIEAARQNVERYRELRNASAARLIGGAA